MLVQEIAAAEWVKGGTGAFPGGMDSGNWDVHWFDAVRICQQEESLIEKERRKAEDRRA